MTMENWVEQRWNERRAVQFEVELNTDGQPPLPAVCRDLGFGGMYIETNLRTLSVNEGLYVDLPVGKAEQKEHHLFPARVVRVCGNGAGLMFSGFKMDNIRTLRNALYGSGKAGSRTRG
ncbi:MAG: PilZ domain-containing protein [Acidiferrobacterales bacterium]